MREHKRLLVVSVLFLTLVNAGCSDPYRAAIQGSDDVSQAVSAAIPFVGQYYAAGKLTDEEKANAAGYLNVVTIANQKFRQGVIAAHNSGAKGTAAYLSLAQVFVNSVPTDPAIFHYKSQEAKTQFDTVLKAVKASIEAISIVIQSGKQTKAGG